MREQKIRLFIYTNIECRYESNSSNLPKFIPLQRGEVIPISRD